ncbi:ImmA/IrrE family metallo-endopeptidase [uncultured Dubosiella sp.]|uniref:ImmA/IrrE family metallo-endopeptidase n=1 Tax=uncultured Dubosiella sp. TaxID=1937011 RepID=UPI00338E4BC7
MTFDDYCAIHNINVIYFNFTCRIRGLCTFRDGDYLIAINPRFASESQRKTFEHELIHILESHLGSCTSGECEAAVTSLLNDEKFVVHSL